jgi:outer membrane lipoprotein SlyB
MKQKLIPIFAWILGFSIGFLGGAYIGLILGGTFLGGFDIYAATGYEGYELSTYAGAIIGGIVLSIIAYKSGVKLGKKTTNSK